MTFEATLAALNELKHNESHNDVVWGKDFEGQLKEVECLDSGSLEKQVRAVYFFPAQQKYLAIEYNVDLTKYQNININVQAYEVWPETKTITIYSKDN